ncbi:hypothetical protein GTA26_28000 [Rhodococcus hoagii]|nr:hypothetical protein [Prescottella equi]
MSEDFPPDAIIIFSERLADGFCLAQSVLVGHFFLQGITRVPSYEYCLIMPAFAHVIGITPLEES